MMTGGSGARIQFLQQQAIIRRSAAITQNQWYDFWTGGAVAAGAGSTKKNCRINSLCFEQATANEDIEIRIIADSLDETVSQTATAGTNYAIIKSEDPDTTTTFLTSTADQFIKYRAFLIDGRSIQIMYRKTTAAGANNTTIKGDISISP